MGLSGRYCSNCVFQTPTVYLPKTSVTFGFTSKIKKYIYAVKESRMYWIILWSVYKNQDKKWFHCFSRPEKAKQMHTRERLEMFSRPYWTATLKHIHHWSICSQCYTKVVIQESCQIEDPNCSFYPVKIRSWICFPDTRPEVDVAGWEPRAVLRPVDGEQPHVTALCSAAARQTDRQPYGPSPLVKGEDTLALMLKQQETSHTHLWAGTHTCKCTHRYTPASIHISARTQSHTIKSKFRKKWNGSTALNWWVLALVMQWSCYTWLMYLE